MVKKSCDQFHEQFELNFGSNGSFTA